MTGMEEKWKRRSRLGICLLPVTQLWAKAEAAEAADELLSIEGVNASFVMFPTGTTVNISARSLGDVNVQIIMEALGGGGHLTMAGAQLQNMTVRQARETLVSVLNNTLSAASKQPVAGNKDGK